MNEKEWIKGAFCSRITLLQVSPEGVWRTFCSFSSWRINGRKMSSLNKIDILNQPLKYGVHPTLHKSKHCRHLKAIPSGRPGWVVQVNESNTMCLQCCQISRFVAIFVTFLTPPENSLKKIVVCQHFYFLNGGGIMRICPDNVLRVPNSEWLDMI